MRIRVTWPANPAGENIPLLALGQVRVHVAVIDEHRNRASKAAHDIRLRLGNTDLPKVKLGPAVASFLIPPAKGWLQQKAEFTAQPEAPDSTPTTTERKVVGRALRNASRLAVYVIAAAALYIAVLIPNVQGVMTFLSEQPTLPLLGLGTLLVSFWQDWWTKQLLHPWRPIGTAFLALVFLLVVHRGRVLVVNRSLDTLKVKGGAPIAPGGFAIVEEGDLVLKASRQCSGEKDERIPLDETNDCVRFGTPPDVGVFLRNRFVISKRYVGCVDHHPVGKKLPEGSWKDSASCRPTAGISFVKAKPQEVLVHDGGPLPQVNRVSAQLEWLADPGELIWPKTSKLQAIQFQPFGEKVDTTLIFQRKDPLLEIEVTLDNLDHPISVLSPLANGKGGLLDAEVLVGRVAYGKLLARLTTGRVPSDPPSEAEFSPKCWFARSGPRLSQLFARDDHELGSSQFTAQRPETVSLVPICWSDSDRPDYGEIHLDQSWGPSAGWTLVLPSKVAPRNLSILDQDGHTWGKLTCPETSAQTLQVAPIAIDKPTKEVQTLRRSAGERDAMWEASAAHAIDYWAWACWAGDAPAATYSGGDRWSLRGDPKTRRYHAGRGGRACYLRVDRSEVPVTQCHRAPLDLEQSWYAAQGPADCDRQQSRLCQ